MSETAAKLKVDREDVSVVKKVLTIEVAPDEISRAETEILKGYSRQVRIPGFRPGKAPMSVLRKHFGDSAKKDVQERVMTRSFHEAIKQENLQPVADPAVEDVHFEPGEPLRYKATFEVVPEFEVQGYKNIEIRRADPTVNEAQVDEFLEELRKARANFESVEGKISDVGDLVVCDMTGEVDGEAHDKLSHDNMSIEIGDEQNLPQFNDHLEGAKAGDKVKFDVPYPDEYPAEELAGKAVTYKVSVKEVKVKQLADLDDEFAKDVGDFDTLVDLRNDVHERLSKSKEEQAKGEVRNGLLDKLLLENPIVLPESLVDLEIRHRLEEVIHRMMSQGMDPEKAEIDWEKMRDEQREGAQKSVHARLVLDAVAKAESVQVSDAEVRQRIAQDAQRMGQPVESLLERMNQSGGLQALSNQLVREKALDLVEAVANIQNEE